MNRKSAWESNVKMIADAIETNETIFTMPSSVSDSNKAVSVYGMTMKVTRVICKLLPGRWIAKIMGK